MPLLFVTSPRKSRKKKSKLLEPLPLTNQGSSRFWEVMNCSFHPSTKLVWWNSLERHALPSFILASSSPPCPFLILHSLLPFSMQLCSSYLLHALLHHLELISTASLHMQPSSRDTQHSLEDYFILFAKWQGPSLEHFV